MDIALGVVIGIIIFACVLVLLIEYRIRQPDFLVLHEFKGQILLRMSPLYPRHSSLVIKRTTCPIQSTIDATAAGNLAVQVKLDRLRGTVSRQYPGFNSCRGME